MNYSLDFISILNKLNELLKKKISLNIWFRSNPQSDDDGDNSDSGVGASRKVFRSGFRADICVKKTHS